MRVCLGNFLFTFHISLQRARHAHDGNHKHHLQQRAADLGVQLAAIDALVCDSCESYYDDSHLFITGNNRGIQKTRVLDRIHSRFNTRRQTRKTHALVPASRRGPVLLQATARNHIRGPRHILSQNGNVTGGGTSIRNRRLKRRSDRASRDAVHYQRGRLSQSQHISQRAFTDNGVESPVLYAIAWSSRTARRTPDTVQIYASSEISAQRWHELCHTHAKDTAMCQALPVAQMEKTGAGCDDVLASQTRAARRRAGRAAD